MWSSTSFHKLFRIANCAELNIWNKSSKIKSTDTIPLTKLGNNCTGVLYEFVNSDNI